MPLVCLRNAKLLKSCAVQKASDCIYLHTSLVQSTWENTRHRLTPYLICNIIHNYDAMSSSIVTGSDSSKPLLPRCVPLQDKQDQLLQCSVTQPCGNAAWLIGHPAAGIAKSQRQKQTGLKIINALTVKYFSRCFSRTARSFGFWTSALKLPQWKITFHILWTSMETTVQWWGEQTHEPEL